LSKPAGLQLKENVLLLISLFDFNQIDVEMSLKISINKSDFIDYSLKLSLNQFHHFRVYFLFVVFQKDFFKYFCKFEVITEVTDVLPLIPICLDASDQNDDIEDFSI
jgi:hypothetical protein